MIVEPNPAKISVRRKIFVTDSWADSCPGKRILGTVKDAAWTSEGRDKKRRSKKRRPESDEGKPNAPTPGARPIVDPWTQAILPPGSDENPNVPGM